METLRADDHVGRRSRALALSTGAVAAALVVVMVVTVTPRGSGTPSAVSATTIPAASVQLRAQPAGPRSLATSAMFDDTVRLGHARVSHGQPVALVGAPNAISTAPTDDPGALDVAEGTPDESDDVIVLTSSFTYLVPWGDLTGLVVPDGSIVMTAEGALLATFVAGDLRVLVD